MAEIFNRLREEHLRLLYLGQQIAEIENNDSREIRIAKVVAALMIAKYDFQFACLRAYLKWLEEGQSRTLLMFESNYDRATENGIFIIEYSPIGADDV